MSKTTLDDAVPARLRTAHTAPFPKGHRFEEALRLVVVEDGDVVHDVACSAKRGETGAYHLIATAQMIVKALYRVDVIEPAAGDVAAWVERHRDLCVGTLPMAVTA